MIITIIFAIKISKNNHNQMILTKQFNRNDGPYYLVFTLKIGTLSVYFVINYFNLTALKQNFSII